MKKLVVLDAPKTVSQPWEPVLFIHSVDDETTRPNKQPSFRILGEYTDLANHVPICNLISRGPKQFGDTHLDDFTIS